LHSIGEYTPVLGKDHAQGENMRTLLTLIGIIALLAGLLFAGQGSGYIPWPAESFMISETRWVYYGAVIAAAGALLIIIARRSSDL
jgi:hypothetical protein